MLNAFRGMYWAWKGKAFGNQVADLMGIHRALYHGAMEEGGCQMHMLKLYQLKEEGVPIERVAVHSCKFLIPGLGLLEERFGPQDLIVEAKAIAFEWMGNAGKFYSGGDS